MKISSVAAIASALSANLASAFQYNLYSDDSCGNYIDSFTGENSQGAGPGTSKDYSNGLYIGSVLVVTEDDWTSELSWDNSECLYYDTYCCAYAPDCKYGYQENPGCMALGQTVTSLQAFYTNCDSSCFDASYKRSNNATASVDE